MSPPSSRKGIHVVRNEILAAAVLPMLSLMAASCLPDIRVPPNARVTCGSDRDCLSGFFCNDSLQCDEINPACTEESDPVSECLTIDEAPGICQGRGCIASVCGDAYTDSRRREECDRGAENVNGQRSTCHIDCKFPVCGDGRLGGDEMCEPGVAFASGRCLSACIPKCETGFGDCDGEASNGCECEAELISDIDTSFARKEILALGDFVFANTGSEIVRFSQSTGVRRVVFSPGFSIAQFVVCGEQHLCVSYLDLDAFESRIARFDVDGQVEFNVLSSFFIQGMAARGEILFVLNSQQLISYSPEGTPTVLEDGLRVSGIENSITIIQESLFWISLLDGVVWKRDLVASERGFSVVVADVVGPQDLVSVGDDYFLSATDGVLRRFDDSFYLLEQVMVPISGAEAQNARMVSGEGFLLLTGNSIEDGSFLGIAIDPRDSLGRFRVIASSPNEFGLTISRRGVWLTTTFEQQRIPLLGPSLQPVDAGPLGDGGPPNDGGPLSDGGPLNDGGNLLDIDAGEDGGATVPLDAGTLDGGEGDDGGFSNPIASAEIQDVRDGVVPQVIDGAVVVDLRPFVPGAFDEAGFFTQAEKNGPALFVSIEPDTFGVAIGDIVSFEVTQTRSNQGRIEVTSVESFSILERGQSVSSFVQDVSGKADLVGNIAEYESELVQARLTIAGPQHTAGPSFVAQSVTTAGVPIPEANLKVRFPQTLDLALPFGCSFDLNARGLWRFNSVVQFSLFEAEDVGNLECPPAEITSITASNATTVVIRASRELDAATVPTTGESFAFTGGLTSVAANPVGASVVITTSQQQPDQEYVLSLAQPIQDIGGATVTLADGHFTGFRPIDIPLLVNEVLYDSAEPGDALEFIEIVNAGVEPVDFGATPIRLVGINGSNGQGYDPLEIGSGTLGAGGRMVVGKPDSLLLATSADLLIDIGTLALQNGAPDGFAMFDSTNQPFAAFVWEGEISSFTFEGQSFDISGLTTIIPEHLQSTGSSCVIPDSTGAWVTCTTATPGEANIDG